MHQALLLLLSFPPSVCLQTQERKPSRRTVFNWVPALAGMTGLVLIGCSSSESAETTKVLEKTDIVLMETDFDGKDLVKGMAMQEAMKNLEFLGWEYSRKTISVSAAGMSNLWIKEPCRAAALDYQHLYKTVSTERPPKNLQLIATFYECEEDKAIKMGQLAEIRIEEENNAKNK